MAENLGPGAKGEIPREKATDVNDQTDETTETEEETEVEASEQAQGRGLSWRDKGDDTE